MFAGNIVLYRQHHCSRLRRLFERVSARRLASIDGTFEQYFCDHGCRHYHTGDHWCEAADCSRMRICISSADHSVDDVRAMAVSADLHKS